MDISNTPGGRGGAVLLIPFCYMVPFRLEHNTHHCEGYTYKKRWIERERERRYLDRGPSCYIAMGNGTITTLHLVSNNELFRPQGTRREGGDTSKRSDSNQTDEQMEGERELMSWNDKHFTYRRGGHAKNVFKRMRGVSFFLWKAASWHEKRHTGSR